MKALYTKSLLLTSILAFLLISCGGGGGMTAGGGIDGSGIISVGAVSAFGSIVVNGTEFDTGNAVLIVGGEELGIGDDIVRANLDVGRVVTVEGTISEDGNDLTADQITYNDNVKGYYNTSLKDFMIDLMKNFRKATKKEIKGYTLTDLTCNLTDAKSRLGLMDVKIETTYSKPYSESNHAKQVNYYGKNKTNQFNNL